MTRFILILAGLLAGAPSVGHAQNNAAPANVVVPAPAPREGTVGPEQLRDFALPGTRRQPAASEEAPQRTAPVRAPAQPPAAAAAPGTPPAASGRPPATAPVRSEAGQGEPRAEREQAAPAPASSALVAPLSPATLPPPTEAPAASGAVDLAGEPLPPIAVTQAGNEAPPLVPAWWPWLLVSALAGVGLALAVRQRRKLAPAGHDGEQFERAAPGPTAAVRTPRTPAAQATAPAPRPAAAPAPAPALEPGLPTGMVTTRLRGPAAPEPVLAPPPATGMVTTRLRGPAASEPVAAPLPAAGGVVSTRLRAWVGIELVVREILFSAQEAVMQVDLILANEGSAAARDIALEALTINGGDEQAAEITSFFERPPPAVAAIPEIGPLSDRLISHELRMPRGAIRAYEVQGRTVFVPVVVLNASYRTGAGEGRTSTAFLIGREVAGSDKLAPLLLPQGSDRALGLGVRRLEQAVRR